MAKKKYRINRNLALRTKAVGLEGAPVWHLAAGEEVELDDAVAKYLEKHHAPGSLEAIEDKPAPRGGRAAKGD